MNRKSIRIGMCAKWMMGVLLLVTTSVSYASSTTLVGGGSTMPSNAYVGYSSSSLVYPPGTGSLFAVADINASYCKTSDAVAQEVFFGGPLGITVQGTCPSQGFGAGGVGRTDLTQPNYLALDMPLSAADYSNYQASHGTTAYPTQFPAVAAAIAIAFNLRDSEGNQVTSSEVNFTDAQLCSIFDGAVTNWDATSLASAFTLPAGDSIPSEPINVQYRSDGTGTTLGLSNHLAAVCGEFNSTNFEASTVFTSVVANFFASGIPSNWTGSSDNADVAAAVASTANSIGYVETANALAESPGLQFADLNGASPITNFGTPLNLPGSDIVYNEVISTTNNANGTPALVEITNPPSTQCIALVRPGSYAKAGVLGGIVPTGTYSIVAVTYLLGDAEGNGSDLASVQALAESPYNATFQSAVTTAGSGTGLAFFTLGGNAFTATDVAECLTK
jgi:phosphate transport system substrate-binding protein